MVHLFESVSQSENLLVSVSPLSSDQPVLSVVGFNEWGTQIKTHHNYHFSFPFISSSPHNSSRFPNHPQPQLLLTTNHLTVLLIGLAPPPFESADFCGLGFCFDASSMNAEFKGSKCCKFTSFTSPDGRRCQTVNL